jgi:hypothetical protein
MRAVLSESSRRAVAREGWVTMPVIDRNADIKVHRGTDVVAAEIPLVGHAGRHWLVLFRTLASKSRQEPCPDAEDREDRTWVIVRVPGASKDLHPEVALDAVTALIGEVNAMEQQSGTAPTEAAIRDWWARQQR